MVELNFDGAFSKIEQECPDWMVLEIFVQNLVFLYQDLSTFLLIYYLDQVHLSERVTTTIWSAEKCA